MSSLFLLQYTCLLVFAMQTLVLVVSRFQVSVVNRQYEKSRWSLVTAALLLVIHYGLQMVYGFRAHSDDAGVIVNILFYTPVAFLVSHSILNLECEKRRRRRYDLLFVTLFVATLVAFGSGWLTCNSLYMPYEQMVLHTLYLVSMIASIFIPISVIHRNRSRVEAETGGDIMPYVRYTWAGYLLFSCTSLALVGAIMWRPLLFVVGPAVLLSAVIFNMSFVAMGYNLAPIDEVLTDVADDEADDAQSMADGDADELASGNAVPERLSPEMVCVVEAALAAWCAEKNFRDTTVNMVKLSQSIGVVRRTLSIYFDQHLHTTFRIWLSDIRFKEAQDYIKAHPEYTNESVSSACGFTSRSQLYKIFSDRTGMTPREWRDGQIA
ncbi:helix-turn-helix domain-containing protein [Prevotellamassilia timonensis]|uniref:helix-turn-helix domain-containing protein n=1 Tax=Prevotellamassilia timonensis TaxID=1852370 RepID=UPI0009F5E421|nr:helix-turn-helix domain-containing protein [Prevotellamassilia timonensis]